MTAMITSMRRVLGPTRFVAVLVLALLGATSLPAAATDARPQPTSKPTGAAVSSGADEWYSVALPDGKVSTLGVYRPEKPNGSAVLLFHGKDGPRRLYEDLAQRYASKGFIAIAACWFEYPEQQFEDAYDCPGVGPFLGAEPAVIADVDVIVSAAHRIRGVRLGRLGVEGQSYGARVVLLRAAESGSPEPVVSSCGYLSAQPVDAPPEVPKFPYPAEPDVAARLTSDVLVAHGEADPITPIGQAHAFAEAMRAAGHPITLVTYGSPGGHFLPWDVVSSFDQPDELLRDRFLDDTARWLAEHTGVRHG
jgi:dienelactone hydrolase